MGEETRNNSVVLVFAFKNYHELPDPDWATTDGEIRNRAIELWNGRLN